MIACQACGMSGETESHFPGCVVLERQNLLAAVAQQSREIVTLSDTAKQLRQELSLAEEGLANYAQEVERLRTALDRVRDADSVEEAFRIAVGALGSQEPQTAGQSDKT